MGNREPELAHSIARHVRARAADSPQQTALISPQGTLTYEELENRSDWCAGGLSEKGVDRGTRVVLMVTPGPEMLVLAFALIKLAAVPVLMDPGIGRHHLRRCIDESEADVFIGVPKAAWASRILGWGRKSIRLRICTRRAGLPGWVKLDAVIEEGRRRGRFQAVAVLKDETAAIVFTSGSTGPPKGVLYTHGMFSAQAELLRLAFGIEPGEVDLATFPLFALFDPALGMTTVFPKMDFTRPGSVDPTEIIGLVNDLQITHMFGSPALLDRVGRFAAERNPGLPSLRRVLSAGAPVSPSIAERFARLLGPEANLFTPYGATEALPVTSVSLEERTRLGGTAEGRGVCVGRPLPGVSVAVINISDGPIPEWSDELCVPVDVVGEIVVWGPNVSPGYFRRPESDQLAKIRTVEGNIRHRMGDLGYCDEAGRIWFCGRKTHRVVTQDGTLFSVCCEGIFNQHPAVFRSALVGIGRSPRQSPAICVELEPASKNVDPEKLREELGEMARSHEMTSGIDTFLIHPGFPVDIRHNAKIGREKLARWVEEQLG